MPDVLLHPPGTVSWLDLGTTDRDGARAFYRRLFGWQSTDDGDAEMTYTRFHRHGEDVGGAYGLMPEQIEGGVRPHWLPYFATEDLDASLARAAELGGTVLADVFEPRGADEVLLGRGAILQDPTGAAFALWEAHAHPGFGSVPAGREGTQVWVELGTRDVEAATAFYTALFDYSLQPMSVDGMTYTIFQRGDRGIGGVYAMDDSYGDAPAHWMVYFAVDDADAAAAVAEEAGGRLCVPPTDIPDVGRFAVIDDPQGATFSILKPLPRST